MRLEHLPRPSVTFDSDPETGVIRFVLVSNGSLSRTQAHGVLVALGLFMTLIAGGFWAQGLWLVLPFSGLEWLTIAYALRWSLRNSEMMEVITDAGDGRAGQAQPGAKVRISACMGPAGLS